MAAGAKNKGLPKFLGSAHLLKWLTRSPDGLALLEEANREWLETETGRTFVEKVRNAEEWLRTTVEGQKLIAEATKETTERPRVLVVLFGNNEVQVFAEANARIKLVNVKGTPSSVELSEKTVGYGWGDLVYWPNPEPPKTKATGRGMTDLEIACVKQAADATEAAERAIAGMGAALRLSDPKQNRS